ncbi:thioredoxin family protein [Prochlorococcus sp. MIT 1307]|uniref:thioredoxin family protein n=1 Tax=Prochlorococcus sp. MIT 1307 TaxID=3096219 RepID=UPI002A754AB2|nr:thioredoxin family protein [Prochlorococcus sp. MIT 1307]
MVKTLSTMLPLGTTLPEFELAVVKGTPLFRNARLRGLDQINNTLLELKPVLVMIICSHCPFVKHIEEELTKLDDDYGNRVQMLAIASNSLITHPQDGPENLASQAQKQGWTFPYLLDTNQNFAKALNAACTPDFFLFSPVKADQQQLRYRGQLDGSRPGSKTPVTGNDLRLALDAVLEDKDVSCDQTPSIGCNIKWHPGEEPFWFSGTLS